MVDNKSALLCNALEKVGVLPVFNSGSALFRPEHILKNIEFLNISGFTIVGVEVFEVRSSVFVPRADFILDLSDVDDESSGSSKEGLSTIASFLRTVGNSKNLLVELVLL